MFLQFLVINGLFCCKLCVILQFRKLWLHCVGALGSPLMISNFNHFWIFYPWPAKFFHYCVLWHCSAVAANTTKPSRAPTTTINLSLLKKHSKIRNMRKPTPCLKTCTKCFAALLKLRRRSTCWGWVITKTKTTWIQARILSNTTASIPRADTPNWLASIPAMATIWIRPTHSSTNRKRWKQ